jgi:glycosyltransferase involved in cell wall biosynthesis
MITQTRNHIVVIEAYDGMTEFPSTEAAERASSRGLGLPLEEIAESLDSRITVLCWDAWRHYEQTGKSFFSWMPAPATRAANWTDLCEVGSIASTGQVKWIHVPLRDPEHGLAISAFGLSALSHGLLADSDSLFFLSYCLNEMLVSLFRDDPFQAVILPMLGGLGYVAQMARATNLDGHVDVPFCVVVTDTSANRQVANQEGMWSRPAVTRRQMEDLSLALADLPIVFGPRGLEIARQGRLHEGTDPIWMPRQIPKPLLDSIEKSADLPVEVNGTTQIFLQEPQEPASGVLLTLDAAAHMRNQGGRLHRPIISAGPDTVFAPMAPRSFIDYWSSRGFVRELIAEQRWKWQAGGLREEKAYPVRLYPALFEHLPFVWSEMAQGSCVFVSSASAEGLALDESLPRECILPEAPAKLAQALDLIGKTSITELDRLRRRLFAQVSQAHRGSARAQMLEKGVRALRFLCNSTSPRQKLGRVSRLLLDRRTPLRMVEQTLGNPRKPEPSNATRLGTLSVVLTCFEMGQMIGEAVRSVWAADRQADEVLLVDDGSYGDATLSVIQELEREAAERRLPLTVIKQNNRGLAAARNVGLETATGEFISFLDGDDLIRPEFYGLATELLLENPELGGVAAWAICEGPGDEIGFWNAPQPELPFLFTENTVFVPCVVRKALLQHLGGYDVRQRYNYEDWELSCRMLASGWPIVTIPAYLEQYRIRSESMYRSMTPVQNQIMREMFFETHRETVSTFGLEIAMLTENRLMKELDSNRSRSVINLCSGFSVSTVVRKVGKIARSYAGGALRSLKTK